MVGTTVVRHMRIAVHDTADAVAAEFKVDRITVFASHIADGCGNITQTVARLCSGDTSFQSLFGALDQAQILRILMFADHKADGGIGNPTVDVDRQIEADQIAVFQVVVERNAMQHRIVHGNANVVRERSGAKIRSVVDVAGFGSLAIDDALVHEFVDFQQIGTNFGEFLEITQNTADETSGRLHLFDLFRCFQFNHAYNPTSYALQCMRFLRSGNRALHMKLHNDDYSFRIHCFVIKDG